MIYMTIKKNKNINELSLGFRKELLNFNMKKSIL